MRAELRTLVRIEPPLEERAEDRRIDLRPIQRRRLERRIDLRPVHRQRVVVIEQPAVEPGHRLEPDPASGGHRCEEISRQSGELLRPLAGMLEHPGEHVVVEQAHVLGEHAEHESVHEMRHGLRVMAPLAERLRELRERRRGAPGERLATLARAQAPRIGHRPLELVPYGSISEIVQHELVHLAHGVGPVGAYAEPHHVRDDQQRRILKRQRVLAQLGLIAGGGEILR